MTINRSHGIGYGHCCQSAVKEKCTSVDLCHGVLFPVVCDCRRNDYITGILPAFIVYYSYFVIVLVCIRIPYAIDSEMT